MYGDIARLIDESGEEHVDTFFRGKAGGENSAGAYAIRVDDEPNQIYVRLESGDRESQLEAINLNVPIAPDYPVLIYYIKGQKLPNAIVDPAREAQYRNNNEALSTVAPHSHEPGQGNYDPVSTIRMREGQLSLSEPYSMNVDISGLKYYDDEGHEQWFNGNSLDLTDFLPVTAATHRIVKVMLNRILGELAAIAGDEVPLTLPLGEEDLAAIPVNGFYKNLAGVRLTYGQTVIDDIRDILDWRFWIDDPPNISGVDEVEILTFHAISDTPSTPASGNFDLYFKEDGVDPTGLYYLDYLGNEFGPIVAGGSTVDELSDLNDVSTAAQLANYVLAAGDGNTGGDYRGRLLVEDDIPALDASHITAGLLATNRGGFGVDVSAQNGIVWVNTGVATFIKIIITNVDPTAADDNLAGYVVGSRWINTSTPEEFVALDTSTGTAVWLSTTQASTGLTVSGIDPTVNEDSSSGYTIGNLWVNTVTPEAFILVDNSVGFAVWMSITGGGTGGVPVFHGVKDTGDETLSSSGNAVVTLDNFPGGVYDTDGFETSATKYEIPTGFLGYYQIGVNISCVNTGMSGTNAGKFIVEILINGSMTDYITQYFNELQSTEIRASLITQIQLSDGDLVSFRLTNQCSDDINLSGIFMLNLIGT